MQDTAPPIPPARADAATDAWRPWLVLMFLALGATLTLAAILYFFASNWSWLRAATRFALVESGFAACVGGAMAMQTRSPRAADIALTAAGTLTGVFWAVFGQIYQTGADAWQLFALWALCVTPWLLLRPSAALWALWLTVGNVALGLWVGQTGLLAAKSPWGEPLGRLTTPLLPLIAANAALWAGCLAMERLYPAARQRARLFGLMALAFLLIVACFAVCVRLVETVLGGNRGDVSIPLSAGAGLVALALAALYAWRARKTGRDTPLFMIALCGFPLLNCALLHVVDTKSPGSILGWYTAVNLVYTALMAHGFSRRRRSAPDLPLSAGPRTKNETTAGSILSVVLGGMGGTLSALLVAALTAYILDRIDGRIFPGMLLAAIPFLLGGTIAARGGGSFARTMSLVLSGAGFIFLGMALLDSWSVEAAAVAVAVVTSLLYPFHRHAEWRFTAVICSLVFLLAALDMGAPHFLSLAARHALIRAVLALCSLSMVWLTWRGHPPRALMPALYAVCLILALYLPDWSFVYGLNGWSPPRFTGNVLFLPAPFQLSLFSILFGAALLILLTREGHRCLSAAQACAALAGLAALLVLVPAYVLFALTLIFLGRARCVKGLIPLGLILLGIYLIGYYAALHTSFLHKTMSMGGPGLILLAGAGVMAWSNRKNHASPTPQAENQSAVSQRRISGATAWRLAAVLLMLATLGTFQYAIFAKERLLAAGDTLLLALAPLDPRSLIQGDYMALRYALEDDLRAQENPLPPRGWVLVRKDSRGVGRLAGVLNSPKNLKPGEYSVPFSLDFGDTGLPVLHLPGSFLFQEDHVKRYADAAYGILRCVPSGDCLLTDLADAEGRPLGGEEGHRPPS